MWVGKPPHTRLTVAGRAGHFGLFAVNFAIFRGRFWGLGVKLGVVNSRFSQCSAILYGVRIGVVAVSCFQQGKQSARLSAVHIWRG